MYFLSGLDTPLLRHPVLAFRDSPQSSLKIPTFRADFYILRHQRQANSRHTMRISAFYLCFEFCWCREKTPYKPATGASWTVRGEGIESDPDRRRIGPVRSAHQSLVVLPVDRTVSDFYHKHLKVVLSFVGRKRS